MTDYEEVIARISDGTVDEHLDEVIQAVQERRNHIGELTFDNLSPGDRGFLRQIKPKYLSGLPVEFVRHRNTKIIVRALETRGKVSHDQEIIVPPTAWRYNNANES